MQNSSHTRWPPQFCEVRSSRAFGQKQTSMYDERTLLKIGALEPLSATSEDECHEAVARFCSAIDSHSDLRSLVDMGSYDSFVSVFVYSPAEAVRRNSENGEVRVNYEGQLLFFHKLAPVVALGKGGWGESLRPDGTWSSRGYDQLDIENLVTLEQVLPDLRRSRIATALEKTTFALLSPAYLMQPAPSDFEPDERSIGEPPWDRLFHVYFQFCD